MPNTDEDIVYTIDKSDKEWSWMVTAHKLMAGKQASGSELLTLCKSQEPITGLKVMEGGRTLVATSGKCLMTGQRNASHQTSFSNITYTWRELTLPEYITCFDARIRINTSQSQPAGLAKLKNRNVASKSSADIVVGNSKGEIYIYRDLPDLLIQRERPSKAGKAATLAASLQHWHREAVSTVKWSSDGESLFYPYSNLVTYMSNKATTLSLVVWRRYSCYGSWIQVQGSIFPICRQLSIILLSRLVALRTRSSSQIIPSWFCQPQN